MTRSAIAPTSCSPTPAQTLEAFLNPVGLTAADQSRIFDQLLDVGGFEANAAADYVWRNQKFYPGSMRTKAVELRAKRPKGRQRILDSQQLLELFSSVGVGASLEIFFKRECPRDVGWLFKFSVFDLGERHVEAYAVAESGRWERVSNAFIVKTTALWMLPDFRATIAHRLRSSLISVEILPR